MNMSDQVASYTSEKLFQIIIGESTVSIFQFTDSNEYILSIQDLGTSNIAICGKENGEYKVYSEDGTFPNNHIIIDSLTKLQLSELGCLLSTSVMLIMI